jgi:putative ATP-binding cassette transporter
MDKAPTTTIPEIETCDSCGMIAFEGVTLRSRRSNRILVDRLNVAVPVGTHLLIRTANDSAKNVLFRATADLWDKGEGRILRPGLDDMLFMPEHPYLPPGTLRDVLLHTGQEKLIADEQILSTLRELNVEKIVIRAGGLDVERKWSDLLSLGEQQLIAFARVLLAAPSFVFLDHPGKALSECRVNELLALLRERKITYLTLGDNVDPALYDELLEIADDGTWKLRSLAPASTNGDRSPDLTPG